jgi:hypothetical protein
MASISDLKLIRPVLNGNLEGIFADVDGTEKHLLEIILGALQLPERAMSRS